MTITKQQKALIADTWRNVAEIYNNLSWDNYADQLLALTITETKSHDRFRSGSIRRGMSKLCEAQYFAIKRLWEYRNGDDSSESTYALSATDYLMMQKSCFAAYCLMTNARFTDCRARVLERFGADMERIAILDYCDLIKE